MLHRGVCLYLALVELALMPLSTAFIQSIFTQNHRSALTAANGKSNLQEALFGGGGGGGDKKDNRPKGERKAMKKRKDPRERQANIAPAFTDVSGVSLPPPGKIQAWELTLSEKLGPRKFACCRPAEGQVQLARYSRTH